MRAKSLRTSHHPVREGLMTCASCHNPHDSTHAQDDLGELRATRCACECHTEKRGPFLWEHAPVRENCLNCHDPHGSNHDKLLVSQQPWLCQRCHANTRHPGTFYSNINAGTSVELSVEPRDGARLQELPPERPRRQRAHGAVSRTLRREP